MSMSLDIKTFLSQIALFSKLNDYGLDSFAAKIDIAYFKKDAVIAKAGDTFESFYIVAKGIAFDGTTYFEVKDFFDFDAALSGVYALTYMAAEESLLYKIAKDDFLALVHTNPDIERYFLQSAAKKISERTQREDNNMIRRIKEIGFQKPLFVSYRHSVFETVSKMTEANSTFALIKYEDDTVGIVTDSDLRKRVILKRLSYDTPIEQIATRGVYQINAESFLFNAMLEMTKHNVKRLLVIADNKVAGVLQDIDILSTFSNQAQFVARKIEKARNHTELKEALSSLSQIIEQLLNQGVKARHICKLVSELNAQLFKKLFDELADIDIKDKICLLMSGSEGRGEQILRTDQDNMIIIEDGFHSPKIDEFAKKLHDTLAEIGFPECPGNVMVTNELWRAELGVYKDRIFEAINHPTADGFLYIPILMDAKPIAGNYALCNEFKSYLSTHLTPRLIAQFAKASLSFDTPLSLFNAFIVGKKEHDCELDIKKGGIFAIVNGVRALAYENNIISTNTFAKLKELSAKDLIDKALAEEMIEAYNFLLEIRLKERLYKIKSGKTPDNYINPARLSKLERDLLKDVFKIVDKFKKYLHAHFKLGYIV
ncbi:MAG: hypothetical protein RL154_1211 [Pseudomonadota bacterium]|jgi:CBS domain-containing protein